MEQVTDSPAEHKQTKPVDPERAGYTAGLRQIADWLDAHPEVPLPYIGAHSPGSPLPSLSIFVQQPWDDNQPSVREQMATIARAMGRANKAPGRVDGTFVVWRSFAGINVHASAHREEVCERVVVGSHEVTEEVPDPEALAAVPKVKRTKTVEQVKWVCSPLLANGGAEQ